MVNEDDIKRIKEVLDVEFEDSISLDQIKRIDMILDEYVKNNDNPDELKLLLYSCKMKNYIDNYIFSLNEYAQVGCTRFCDNKYSVNRTVHNIDDRYKYRVQSTNRFTLEKKLEKLEDDIRRDPSLTHYKNGKKLIKKI